MEKAAFTSLLREMSVADRDFATRFVTNELPASFRYFVHLNQSYDGNPLLPGEQIFPADAELADTRIGPLDDLAVMSLLWRDGVVPEWIDISVVDADATHTYFQLLCCGRYTADETLMYYREQGPFGVKSPAIPPYWTVGMARFDLKESPRRSAPRASRERTLLGKMKLVWRLLLRWVQTGSIRSEQQ